MAAAWAMSSSGGGGTAHRPGALKQSNKPFKSRHASKVHREKGRETERGPGRVLGTGGLGCTATSCVLMGACVGVQGSIKDGQKGRVNRVAPKQQRHQNGGTKADRRNAARQLQRNKREVPS